MSPHFERTKAALLRRFNPKHTSTDPTDNAFYTEHFMMMEISENLTLVEWPVAGADYHDDPDDIDAITTVIINSTVSMSELLDWNEDTILCTNLKSAMAAPKAQGRRSVIVPDSEIIVA